MTAYEIHEKMKNYIPFWDHDENENDAENVAYIQSKIDAGILTLYDTITADTDAMKTYENDADALLYDLITADAGEINELKNLYHFYDFIRAAI